MLYYYNNDILLIYTGSQQSRNVFAVISRGLKSGTEVDEPENKFKNVKILRVSHFLGY